MTLYVPSRVAQHRAPSIVDAPVDRLLRARHIDRLHAIADRLTDEASESAVAGSPRRAYYLEFMAGQAGTEAARIGLEPLFKTLGGVR